MDDRPTVDLGKRDPVVVATPPPITTSPVEALRLEEIERTRVFIKVAFGLTIGGIIIALSTGGDTIALRVVLTGSVASGIGTIWTLVITRDPLTYESHRLLGPAALIVCGGMTGAYYWGTISVVTGLMVYGIYFFSLSAGRRTTTAIYILIATTHGLLGALIMAGAIEDRGLVKMTELSTRDQLAFIIIIEFLYGVAFITARISQQVTLKAVSKLEQAVRQVSQRDALLVEARAELDRVLEIGGRGKFSDHVVGSYRLGVVIGRGGMGDVYQALHVVDGSEAAVKLLHPRTLADPQLVERFVREAQTAARVSSPNIVRVLEVGTTAGEVPYLAMERLRGHDLAHELRGHRRLQLREASVVATELATGLEAARTEGIVHRDLKPNNVFLAERGAASTWTILDFGVSKIEDAGTLTKNQIVGTPAYMAPEQARGEPVDHRADLYSLAAILYRTVTGHLAIAGKDVPTTLYEVVYRIPSRPSQLATLPTDVDRVLAIGLAKDPCDRFETALELAEWFARATIDGLTVEERARADELIVRAPWGTHPEAPRRSKTQS